MIAILRNLVHPPVVYSSAQDLFAFHYVNLVTVWNFMLNSIVTWDVLMGYPAVRSLAPARLLKSY
jgi:hypothetical protein